MVGILASVTVMNPRLRAGEFIVVPAVHYRVKASFGPVRRAGPDPPPNHVLPDLVPLWPLRHRPWQPNAFRALPSFRSSRLAACGAFSLPAARTWVGAAAVVDCLRRQVAVCYLRLASFRLRW